MKSTLVKLYTFFFLTLCIGKTYAQEFELPEQLKEGDSLTMAKTLGGLAVPIAVGIVLVIIGFMNLSLIVESIKEFTKTKEIKTLFNNLLAVGITMIVAAVIVGYIVGFAKQYFGMA